MIGLMSRTTSPSRVAIRRSTPWVAGWCGPMLSVISSWVSPSPAGSDEIVIDSSRRRWSSVNEVMSAPRAGAPWSGSLNVLPVGALFVEREQDRLPPDREVASLGVPLVVLGHEDPAKIGMPRELDPEHVVHLTLGELGPREQVTDRIDSGRVGGYPSLDRDPVHAVHVKQLVQDAQARLLRVVIDAVQTG